MNKWILAYYGELINVETVDRFIFSNEGITAINKRAGRTEATTFSPAYDERGNKRNIDKRNFIEFIKSSAVLYEACNEYSWIQEQQKPQRAERKAQKDNK